MTDLYEQRSCINIYIRFLKLSLIVNNSFCKPDQSSRSLSLHPPSSLHKEHWIFHDCNSSLCFFLGSNRDGNSTKNTCFFCYRCDTHYISNRRCKHVGRGLCYSSFELPPFAYNETSGSRNKFRPDISHIASTVEYPTP